MYQPVRRGGPFDQYAIEVARDSIRRRLTNVGYPFTEVLVNSDVQRSDSVPALAGGAPSAGDGEGRAPPGGRGGAAAAIAQRTAQVEFNIIPGALVHLGEVAVQVQPREGTKQQIPSDVVRDIIGLKPGRLYRQDELERATRNLFEKE